MRFSLLPRNDNFFELFNESAETINQASIALLDLMEHYENVPDRADHYEWRMSIPRDLLTVYNNLTVVDITYANFEARCQSEWSGTCNSDIVQRRMIALEDMSHRVDLLWPKQTLAPAGVRLSLILGGGEDESDTSGA